MIIVRGTYILTNTAVCGRCPSHSEFYPREIIQDHIAHYHKSIVEKVANRDPRTYHGGRPPGSRNLRDTMSSSGVQFKKGIRNR